MRILKASAILGATLVTFGLSIGQAFAGEGLWIVERWTQWHPHQGSTVLSVVGTQKYFSKAGAPAAAEAAKKETKDTDGDGIFDDKDQCPATPKTAKVDAKGCWILSNALFDTGKDNLRADAKSSLDTVVGVLKANPDVKVEVQGHTDNVGKIPSNQKLSERRAKSVAKYLSDNGIAAARLSTAGFGLDRPVADNKTDAGRAQNRRVELNPSLR